MRASIAVLVMTGCTCGASVPSAAPTAHETATPEPAPTAAPEPPQQPRDEEPGAPAPAEARAWRSRLAEARRLAHGGRYVDAHALFAALVRERPTEQRLRCEAGYVAFRADRLDDADHEITSALERWPSPPMDRDREPLAMCLYNRGLVAEARGDREAAATAWRRSLELRPNATVEQRLAALGVESLPAEEPGDDAFTLDDAIRDLREQSPSAGEPEVTRFESPTQGRFVAVVRLTTPATDEDPEECIDETAFLVTPDDVVHLASVSHCLYSSWYDDHAMLGEPTFHAGPPELGEIVEIGDGQWGRGDAEDGGGDESCEESTLIVCAERLDWRCVEIPYSSTCTFECESSGGCDDPDDPSDDDEELPTFYARGYRLDWSIEGADLMLTPDPEVELTERTAPPRSGRIPLVSLFEAAE